MYRSYLKSKVFENQNLFMWCSKESNGAINLPPNSSKAGDCVLSECNETADGDGQSGLYIAKAIVIVEPRQVRQIAATAASTTSTTGSSSSTPLSMAISSSSLTNPAAPATSAPTSPSSSTLSASSNQSEWFLMPHSVDINNDVMRLISNLSTVVQILTRMTNAAALELHQHPERELGFQGLRILLNYADQMYTTLLQPRQLQAERATSTQVPAASSLIHHLFEPMLVAPQQSNRHTEQEEQEEVSSARYLTSHQPRSMLPYRVVAVANSAVAGGAAVAATGDTSTELSAPSTTTSTNTTTTTQSHT